MRLSLPAAIGGTLIVAAGVAGLVRAAVPATTADAAPRSSSAAPIVVTGAYVQAPVPPTRLAAAYFTVYNTTGAPDRLESVITGAGAAAMLHAEQPDGSMAAVANGVVIPAHGSVQLSVGHGHVMIEQLYGPVRAGQQVNIQLTFRDAGPISVVAPVVGLGQKPPTSTGGPK